ncbi:MAG: hypothetical protein JW953_00520 [Anaerolineae bacterium]|nr:hypothetical protein [Anaerolineae bacterium]
MRKLRFTFYPREGAILLLFILLSLVMLYPLSTHLSSMVPDPTDPLLNVWRMQWNARAFLNGPNGVANLFNANIFYPFPLTLAYSEHFLMITAQALPFLLLAEGHLWGMNVSVLLTFILSGYAMYLLVAAWTGRRWAGLVAGLLFAFSPHRFGQLNHLELLVTQWLPLTLLTLHWALTRPGRRYPALFIIFFNLQALSGTHYAFNLTIACALLTLVYALTRRIAWRRGLWLAAAVSLAVTLLLNWPVWRMYLRFSDNMGAIRTPGEVRIYSAALTDYFTSIPHNFIYGKLLGTFGRWQPAGHQFQPLMPVGVTGLLLALLGLAALFWPKARRKLALSEVEGAVKGSPIASTYAFSTTLFLLLLTLLGLLLSFGLNEEALGPGLVPLLRYSPYAWLYEHVALFQGIRVPGRYGILVVLGLVGLAGWGVAWIMNRQWPTHLEPCPERSRRSSRKIANLLVIVLAGLILVEYWSAPLVGPEFPGGREIAPVYSWLQQETPPETVVLELPFQGASEFIYEYYASYHWRRLANGGTGYTPPIYKELRQWFNAFPDARSVDVAQQLGIDLVILHPTSYSPENWQRALADLPLYLPAIAQITQVGDDLVLHLAEPSCQAEPGLVQATLTPTKLDGLPYAAQVAYHNQGAAAFVADVQQVSYLTFTKGSRKNFTEPLVTPANETQAVIIPLQNSAPAANLAGAWLATLNRTISLETPAAGERQAPAPDDGDEPGQPLGLQFADGPRLLAYDFTPQSPTACGPLAVSLQWTGGRTGDTAIVQLLDPFGRVAIEHVAQPWTNNAGGLDTRTLSLPGPLPPGRYGLRVLVKADDGSERLPVTDTGVTIPTDQIPPLPVVIHPGPHAMAIHELAGPPVFGRAVSLLGHQLTQQQVGAGDWLRFSLVWQAEQSIETELTVFTQLLGPDGQVWGQRDNQPGGGWYSTPLWPPGQPVIDDYAFQIQTGAPPGPYRLVVGLYHRDTQQRLPTQTGADFVEIGTVIVE